MLKRPFCSWKCFYWFGNYDTIHWGLSSPSLFCHPAAAISWLTKCVSTSHSSVLWSVSTAADTLWLGGTNQWTSLQWLLALQLPQKIRKKNPVLSLPTVFTFRLRDNLHYNYIIRRKNWMLYIETFFVKEQWIEWINEKRGNWRLDESFLCYIQNRLNRLL